MEIPYGYCHCGCGQLTRISKSNDASSGRVYGKPLKYLAGHFRSKSKPIQQRFDKKYVPVTECGCWLWDSYIDKRGYGYLRVGDHNMFAHRLSWELHHGPISPDMYVCHKCDVPACVNPDHLFLGTHMDNMVDCLTKGRNVVPWKPGEQNKQAKLTSEMVLEIMRLRTYHKLTVREIATQFDISESQITRITRGERWKHLTVPPAAKSRPSSPKQARRREG